MNLYLLRHGIAVDSAESGVVPDAERPLTPRGRRRMLQIARAMSALDVSFDLILSSPLVRAGESAAIVAQCLQLRNALKFTDDLMPGGDPRSLLRRLNQRRPRPKNVLLVGHEPYLSQLIARLVAGNDGLAMELKKGGLCKLEATTLRWGRCATLVWLLTPRHMMRMADCSSGTK